MFSTILTMIVFAALMVVFAIVSVSILMSPTIAVGIWMHRKNCFNEWIMMGVALPNVMFGLAILVQMLHMQSAG